MMRRALKLLLILLALVGLATVAGVIWFSAGGITARAAPSRFETRVARTLRSSAIPGDAKRLANPMTATAENLEEGLAHFADHCAVCHGNDGSGNTTLSRGMYPRPPDLRRPPTQDLSDGELFYIIENGVKMTGMPAFGDGSGESAEGSWGLVLFIRRLPTLTPEEIQRMEALNPKSPEEWRQMEEQRKGAEGDTPAPKPAAKPHTHKHGGPE
jgi:mono/diheme cytochrome c family protein